MVFHDNLRSPRSYVLTQNPEAGPYLNLQANIQDYQVASTTTHGLAGPHVTRGKNYAEIFLKRCLIVYLRKDKHERECAKADTITYHPIILFGHQPLHTTAL